MLKKSFYMPIGILILVICAVCLLSLRSDVPDDPIVIYRVTTPAKVTETAETENTGGHRHADGTFYAEPHAPVEVSKVEVSADGQGVPVMHTMPVFTEPVNTQINEATPKILLHRYKGWREWPKQARELRRKQMEVAKEKP